MKTDSQRHDEYGDDGNFPEIAATLQSRQAERFDDVHSHQKDKQHRQNFGHGRHLSPPCDAGACELQVFLFYSNLHLKSHGRSFTARRKLRMEEMKAHGEIREDAGLRRPRSR